MGWPDVFGEFKNLLESPFDDACYLNAIHACFTVEFSRPNVSVKTKWGE